MARYRPYDYSQMMMVPVTLSEQLVPGSLEHTIHYLVEERLDMRGFDERYRNDETGRRAYDPRVLMKVVLYGYSLGMKGSRRLEAACKQNVIFMAPNLRREAGSQHDRRFCFGDGSRTRADREAQAQGGSHRRVPGRRA